MPTACQSGKSWIISRPTSWVTIWSRTCMFLARTTRELDDLSRTHPHVTDTTHDDRAEDSVKRVSFSVTTLLRLTSGCIPFVLARSWYLVIPNIGIISMHPADGYEDGDVSVDVVITHSQTVSKLLSSGDLPTPSATSNSGEKVWELSVSNNVGSMIDDMIDGEHQTASATLMWKDYKKFKHGKEVPQEVEIQYLKQYLLTQALVHHKHVMHMSHDLLDPHPTNTVDFRWLWGHLECTVLRILGMLNTR
jgi:hypothetical protein